MILITAEDYDVSGSGCIGNAIYVGFYTPFQNQEDLVTVVIMGMHFQGFVGEVCRAQGCFHEILHFKVYALTNEQADVFGSVSITAIKFCTFYIIRH